MQLVPEREFLHWAEANGLRRDTGVLTIAGAATATREWQPPSVPSDLESFIWKLLEAVSNTGPYWLTRPSGTWIDPDPGPLSDQNLNRIVSLVGVPADFVGAIVLKSSEWRDLILLVLTHYVLGWQAPTDIQVVAPDGACVLQTSHHGGVRVQCASEERMAAFAADMTAARVGIEVRTA